VRRSRIDPNLSAQRRPGCNWSSLVSLVTLLLSSLKVVATFLESSNAVRIREYRYPNMSPVIGGDRRSSSFGEASKASQPLSTAETLLSRIGEMYMNVSHKLITLGLAFSLLDSTSVFARPMPHFESGCLSYEKQTATGLVPTTKTSGATGYASRPSANTIEDGWPTNVHQE
jgi:hypothetical protein